MPTQPSAARTTPNMGADRTLLGRPRLRIRLAISIGYGNVDSSDSNSETSTTRTRPAGCSRSAVNAPNAPYAPATYSAMRPPTCTGGRSGSRALTQPDTACTVMGLAGGWRPGPGCPQGEILSSTRVWVVLP